VTALVLGAILAVAAVVLVSLPFFLEPDEQLDMPDDAAERRLELIDERDRALAALKELEFDHQTGKIDDADYRAMVGPLRRAAATALQAIDAEDSRRSAPKSAP
jgi:hypothetical protein